MDGINKVMKYLINLHLKENKIRKYAFDACQRNLRCVNYYTAEYIMTLPKKMFISALKLKIPGQHLDRQ